MSNRVVSGVRPTGRLHLGNYVGTLQNWVNLQNNSDYDCYFFVADWHSLTTGFEHAGQVGCNLMNVFMDLLSIGIQPEKAVLFLQSSVAGHSELFLIYSMITPMGWLERNPTVKEMVRDYELKEHINYGLIGYPVLQAADIALYKGNYVPIGKDQLPHLEMTREIVRKFNHLYGEVFPEPKELLTSNPVLRGLDGRRMSKTLGNTIPIIASKEELWDIVKNAVTDPARVYKTDPGHPDICNVCHYYSVFFQQQACDLELISSCEKGAIGCMDCKKKLAALLTEMLAPFYEKKQELMLRLNDVKSMIYEGNKKAARVAEKTMDEVKSLFGFKVDCND
jgi:tryptophanyl-tRNA synthetase